MTNVTGEIRSGAYFDSVVLMQLQKGMLELDGVLDAGVMMGTKANKDVLEQSGLLPHSCVTAAVEDLIIAVKADSVSQASAALKHVDVLLNKRKSITAGQEFRPRSLDMAVRTLPNSQWVIVSVPGRYAAGVAREALGFGKHVFLYSDNVSVEDEVSLKTLAADKGLLVMGPDCGTAVIDGVGLGFANQSQSGSVGIVAASGTGLQALTVTIDNLGSGITYAIGTGGRDLNKQVGGITSRQALDVLNRDTNTKVIILTSKPISSRSAMELMQVLHALEKPVVVNFLGYAPPAYRIGNVFFASTLREAAELAIELCDKLDLSTNMKSDSQNKFASSQRYIRGLFSGGTLAYETLLVLRAFTTGIYSNIPIDESYKLDDYASSHKHTIIDMGEDEFTIGRLHPMIDSDLRLRRFQQEAADPETAVILLDVVLGYGSHTNPAAELAPVISEAKSLARRSGRHLEVVVLVVGTASDPQDVVAQTNILRKSGAHIETNADEAAIYVGNIISGLNPSSKASLRPVVLDSSGQSLAAINVGLESFYESLIRQGAEAIHVDWQPPAQGKDNLMNLLAKMKS